MALDSPNTLSNGLRYINAFQNEPSSLEAFQWKHELVIAGILL